MLKPKRVKLSGAQYRKRRKAKELEKKIQDLQKNVDFIDFNDTSDQILSLDDEKSNSEDFDNKMNIQFVECQSEMQYSSDPGLWDENISLKVREYLVKIGPVQIKDIVFPSDESGKRFSTAHYKRVLANGEEIHRTWLMYSQHKNALFCFCCKLFAKDLDSNSWSKEGCSNWKCISRVLSMHEKSKSHIDAFRKWQELKKFLDGQNSPDNDQKKLMKEEKEHCRNVLERFIHILKYLTSMRLSLRGSSDKFFERDNGNFLGLIELLAQYDPFIGEHIRRVTTNSYLWKVNYMNDQLLNEIISIMASHTRKKIVNKIKEAKYYSIIISNTSSKCLDEKISLIIRCVGKQELENSFAIQEYFICFLPDNNATGIIDFVMEELNKMTLSVNDLRSQSYDNTLLKRISGISIQDRLPPGSHLVYLLPSVCHCFVLDACNVAKFEDISRCSFFRTVCQIFKSFAHQWELLKKNIPSLSLRTYNTDHWNAEVTVLETLRHHYHKIYCTLLEIANNEIFDIYFRHKCRTLMEELENFHFICSVIVWHEVLLKITPISYNLENSDLGEAVILMNNAISDFKQFKQEGFNDILAEAENIANELDVETTFDMDYVPKVFIKDKPPISDPKEYYIINSFEIVIDAIVNILEETKSQIYEHLNIYGLFYKIHDLKGMDKESLLTYCNNIENALKEGEMGHIIGAELCEEVILLDDFLTPEMSTVDLLNFIFRYNMISSVPNLYILLRILLTYPFVRQNEKSKLEDVSNYLQSRLSEEHSNDLAILCIENEVVKTLDDNEIIDNFMASKCEE